MEERLHAVLDDLARGAALSPSDRNRFIRRAAWLAEATTPDQQAFLCALHELPSPLEESQEALLQALLGSLVQQRRQKKVGPPPADASADPSLVGDVVALYRHLGPKSLARGPLVAWLAFGGREELAELADLLVDDPPTDDADVVQALAPLFRRDDLPVAALFPQLLNALAHVPLAAAVLDLANHICRRQLAPQHPAAVRKAQLMEMLGSLIGLLGRLEEAPQSAGESPREISLRVQQSVALAVALCDALALIGDQAAIAKLHPALSLGHRRLK
ncbi:MAG: hypothetical protein WEH44_04225, partial [Pirellulaceae bacterium]